MRRFYRSVLPAALVFAMTGCFDAEAPKCSDPKVVKLVQETYERELHDMLKANPLAGVVVAALPSKMTAVDSARPIEYDEKVKLRSCKGVARFDDNRTAEIAYTVQLDEKDDSKVYVELELDFMNGLVKEGMMKMILNGTKEQ